MTLKPSLLLPALFVTAALAGCAGTGGSSGNSAPEALILVTPKEDGVTFLFDATTSTDEDGDDLTYAWSFGDGGEAEGALIEYTYAVTNALFKVTLVVHDGHGGAGYAIDEVSLGSGSNVGPEIHLKNATRWVKPGAGVLLDASFSDDHDGDLFAYEWILGNYTAELPPEATFDTGNLTMGMAKSQVFNTVGIYDFHCHPHPWMKQRVVVAEGPNASAGPVDINIGNFSYSQKTITIKPGATVTWTNRDPVEHTATIEAYSPGKIVGTSPILSTKLDLGDYIVRLSLNDGKGGAGTKTYGLRASEDAPASPLVTEKSGTQNSQTAAVPPAPYNDPKYMSYTAAWPQNLTGTIVWTDQNAAQPSDWKITLRDSAATTVIAQCVKEELSCTFVVNIDPGSYFVGLASTGNGVQIPHTITLSAIQYTQPGFGDSEPAAHPHH